MASNNSWEKSTVTPWPTAAPDTRPVAAVRAAITGSRAWEKSSIRRNVSRPKPIMAATSVMVRAVMANAPASSAAWTPSWWPGRAALWARPHTSTTASSFTPVATLRPASVFSCSKPWAAKLDRPPSSPVSWDTP